MAGGKGLRSGRGAVIGTADASAPAARHGAAQDDGTLAEREARFRNTVEHAAIGLAHIAPDGSWLWVNSKLCDILGYDRAELLQKRFQDHAHPDESGDRLQRLRALVRGEVDGYAVERRYIRRGGAVIWIRLTLSLIRKPDGALDYYIVAVEDVDDRKRREQEERFLADATETLSSSLDLEATLNHIAALAVPRMSDWCMVYTVTADGRVERRAAFGHSPESTSLAQRLLSFPVPQDGPIVQAVLKQQPLLFAEASEEDLRRSAANEEHLAVLQALEVRSYILAPLSVGGRALGGIGFSLGGDRRYGERELRLAVELARRAAFALDNARLFEERAATEARLRTITDSLPVLIAYVDRDERLEFANATHQGWFGLSLDQILGKRLAEVVPPETYAVTKPHLVRALAGETVTYENSNRLPGRALRHSLVTLIPERGADGAVSGVYTLVSDITPRKQAEERQLLLMAELDHRVKNTLASIKSVVMHTERTQATKEGFAAALGGRIDTMARAHTLLTASRWEGASLTDLVTEEMQAYQADERPRVSIAGEDLMLRPRAALALGMVVHELATNAAKYGALAVPDGTVEIAWRIEAGRLLMEWTERDGPPVGPPSRSGFGRLVIERVLAYEVGGSARLDFHPGGLACSIEAPLEEIAVRAGERLLPAVPPEAADSPEQPPLAGHRILLVEDSMLVALDMQLALAASGIEVVGPARSVREALRLIRTARFDGAVLDVNLDGETVYPVAEELERLGIGYVFCTGYDARTVLPERYRHVAAVQKPFSPEVLLRLLGQSVPAAP